MIDESLANEVLVWKGIGQHAGATFYH